MHYEKFADGSVKCIEDEIPFELPNGWAWSRFTSIAESITDGDHQPPPQTETGIPFLVISNVSEGKINFDNTRFVSQQYFDSLSQYRKAQCGDILFTVTGSYGIPILIETTQEFCFQRHIAIIRPCTFNSSYACIVLGSSYIKRECDRLATGIAQKTVGLSALRRFLIPIPPEAEQNRIIQKIVSIEPLLYCIIQNQRSLEGTVDILKSRILDLAIRGKLVPQDPNDEPASVLLERIRAEKEELIKQGKIKRDKKESVIFKGEDNSYYEKIGDSKVCVDSILPFSPYDNCEFVRFGSLVELLSGRDLKTEEYNANGTGTPYITGASNFQNGIINIQRWTNAPQVISEKGDILITCKGTIGEIALNDFGTAHIARQVMAIRNNFNLNVDYLLLCIKYYLEIIKSSAQGLIPGISRDIMLDLIVPLPSEKYQTAVVNVVLGLNTMLESMEASLH